MVVIKKQSRGFLRYEMFKRLNTGGSNLEPQEIRNCSARMVGEHGVHFYAFLVEMASMTPFKECAAYSRSARRALRGAGVRVNRELPQLSSSSKTATASSCITRIAACSNGSYSVRFLMVIVSP
jgi:hypothetical protein